MRALRTFLLILLLPVVLWSSPNESKVIKLRKSPVAIRIDGVIDPVWSEADSVNDFFQMSPYYGRNPSLRTTAKVLTTEDALYCLIVCYDPSGKILSNTGKLDDYAGDVVSIMIDTFNDQRTAYKFAVGASGLRNDCRLLDDARNRDYSWDGVWFADATVYNWGYVVEIEVPYRSIQYADGSTSWGLDFDRWIPALNEDLYWCSYEQNEGQRISKFGRLVFEDFHPTEHGLNLELYPVLISKAKYVRKGVYANRPDVGGDLFYNPSPQLTLQVTGNPDFAQIEADPFNFNISRYESYFDERRPFFTQGKEVFMPSGKERNTGFYSPLELFYSRRIGKKLPDGSEVPLVFGSRAFGRLGGYEYGGFYAHTAEVEYVDLDSNLVIEERADFASARVKGQILDNSSLGMLFVGKHTRSYDTGVLDVDGAFRTSDWQWSYQLARSFMNSSGDYAVASGFLLAKEKWLLFIRGNYIGEQFDVKQVGFVPWLGTAELTSLGGPRWFYDEGAIREILVYGGWSASYEKVDGYTDLAGILGLNMQFRNNAGYEITLISGKAKDNDRKFQSFEVDLSMWYNGSARWNINPYGGYARTYNFNRDYLAFYSWGGTYVSWRAMDQLELGVNARMYIEGNPSNKIEEITYNARPFVSVTPINNLNVRVYVDGVMFRSSKKLEQAIAGFLFAYNFSPKSWVYLAINEVQQRQRTYDDFGNVLTNRLRIQERAAVLKLSYLYYF